MISNNRNQKNKIKDTSKTKLKLRLYEVIFIFAVALALYLLLALVTYQVGDSSWSHVRVPPKVSNPAGYIGAYLADFLLCGLGYLAYLMPFFIVYIAWMPCRKLRTIATKHKGFNLSLRLISFVTFIFAGTTLATLNFPPWHLLFGSGGILGSLLSDTLLVFLNLTGANLFLSALFLGSITFLMDISWVIVAERLGRAIPRFVEFIGRKILSIPWRKLFKKSSTTHIEPVFVGNNEIPIKEINSDAQKVLLISSPETIKISRRAAFEKQLPLFEPELEVSLPPLSLLDLPEKKNLPAYTHEQLGKMSHEVEFKLRDFGIDAKVVAVYPGPVVTRFELDLAAGTKVSRITALAKDLARSLSVISVRIVEVIPGKSYVGLELPNEHREIVRLKEILSSEAYETSRATLTLALGKDISGYPVIVDIAKMPHLLVAGTTGAGKSVCLNAMLLSLLYKYTAKDVRLLLIDPKMLELSVYDGIPHLLVPVVTDMKDAINSLRWCVYEMERRYKLLSEVGVRNLSSYNCKVKEAKEKGEPLLDPLWKDDGTGSQPAELEELPYIVVLADEYADMIVVVGKKVEELIARIAQKARAAGIHLILATQRPSVDVITGLIKANIPTRIAFQVSSKIDSRTILDQSGAEQLLGAGDMLYLPPGSGVPIRVHGAFVADEEVHRVVKDLKRRGTPEYVEEILSGGNTDPSLASSTNSFTESDEFSLGEEQDPLYDQAVQIVLESRRASISNVQRRLRIGYNRAARLIETMEKAGLVSAMESNGNRTVLVNNNS